jgi:hypothetical protein
VVIEVGDNVGLVGKSNIPEEMHVVCTQCHEEDEFENIPELARVSTSLELSGPISGRFKPCKPNDVIIEERQRFFDRERWNQLERDSLDMFLDWGEKFLGFSLSGRTYKGYKIAFQWRDHKLVAIEFSGNSASMYPPMDIYRVHRMRTMGLEAQGDNPKLWYIELDGEEAGFENVVRVISHVLCYGYMLDLSRIDVVSPIVDVDRND